MGPVFYVTCIAPLKFGHVCNQERAISSTLRRRIPMFNNATSTCHLEWGFKGKISIFSIKVSPNIADDLADLIPHSIQ